MVKIILWIWIAAILMLSVSARHALTDDVFARATAWSPDGRFVAVGMSDGALHLVDAATLSIINTFDTGHGAVLSLAWEKTGARLAVTAGNQIVIWDSVTQSELARLNTEAGDIDSLSWSPDGVYLASSSQNGFPNNVQIWDITAQRKIFSPVVGDVLSVAWSPDGSQLAITKFGEIQLWDILEQVQIDTIHTPEYSIDLAWSPDGLSLASADAYSPGEATVRLWDAHSGQLLRSFTGHQDVITEVDWSTDGEWLATSSHDGTVRIWDTLSGDTVQLYEGLESSFSVTFSPYGGRVVYGQMVDPDSDATPFQIVVPAPSLERLAAIAALCVRDGDARAESLIDSAPTALDDLPAFVAQVEALPKGAIPPACRADLLAVASALSPSTSSQAASDEDITHITSVAWSPDGVNLGTAQAASTPTSDERYLANSVLDLAWIAEENQILIATADAKIQRIDLDTEEILNTYQNHTLDDFTMALQPDGNLVASADGTGDIHIWNVLTAQTILLIPAPDLLPETEFAVTRPIRDLAWSPNQTEFAVVRADDNIIAIHNVVRGDIVRTLSVGVFPDAIFSLDWHRGHGLIALSSSDNLILNSNTMQVLVTLEDLPNTGPIIEIKWSPDGSKVAGASTSGRVLVWDAESGENLYILEANKNPISSLIWHPLGDYLASGDSKGLITIWEMESGNLIEMIETSNAWINVAFSPHGGRLAFGGFLSDEVIPASSTVPNTTTAISIPAFEVIVPNFLQGEILQAITEHCFESSSVETLNTLLRDNQFSAFVAQVEALPEGAIPPACKADLLAVASALGE